MDKIVREEHLDLVVIGTHGRKGLGKLLMVSVQIFRHANCLVLTVGPRSFPEAAVEGTRGPFLFATDFSRASLHALPYVISSANHFGAKLVRLHVIPGVPMTEGFHGYMASDVMQIRENARITSLLEKLEALMSLATELVVKSELVVEFGSPSEEILQARRSCA